MDSALLRRRFMDTAVADVLRAAEGNSLVGSATLALCVLDYLAYLRPRATGNKANYKELVADYLVQINPKYNPAETYAWRCAMVHTYAEARALAEAGLDGYLMRHRDPGFHLSSRRSRTLLINVDTFVADVVWAAHTFFNDLNGDTDVERRATRLLIVSGGTIDLLASYSEALPAAMPHESLHVALRQLDTISPDLERLRRDVTAIYPPHPLLFRSDSTLMLPPVSGSA
jgi:hypothetical protein